MGALAKKRPGTHLRAEDLAQELGIGRFYLGKVMQQLCKAGLLYSLRGRHGGYRLGSRPEAITLHDVVAAVDPVSHFEACLLGLEECNGKKHCVLHETCKVIRPKFVQMLRDTPISEMGRMRLHNTTME